MVTGQNTVTVYDCAGCGAPIRWNNGWFHFSTKRPCPQLIPQPVQLALPRRIPA